MKVIKFQRPKISIDEFMQKNDPQGIQQAFYVGSLKTMYNGVDQIMMLSTIMDYLEQSHIYYKEQTTDEEDTYIVLLQQFINYLEKS